MENFVQPIELRDIDAGIQAKSSDLAIEGEFNRFPLTINTSNWSFGKRKGITTRYGIMPFPGHNSSDQVNETARTVGSLSGYKPFNLISAEGALSPNHPKKYDSLRNTFDVYENRTSVLGGVILSQDVQPSSNSKDFPVLYWMTMRKRQKTGTTSYQIDLAPSTKWDTTASDGQEIVSQYEEAVGGGSATIPALASDLAAKENDDASMFLNNPRLLDFDPVRTRNTSSTKWFVNWTEHKYNFGTSISDFISRTSATITTAPNSPLYFMQYGVPPIAGGDARKRNFNAEVNFSLSTKAYLCYAQEKTGDLVLTFGKFRLPHLSSLSGVAYINGAGSITTNNSTWSAPFGASSGNYAYCSTSDEYSVSIPIQAVAAVVDGKPLLFIKNKFIGDKDESIAKALLQYTTSSVSSFSNDYISCQNVSESSMYWPQEYYYVKTFVTPAAGAIKSVDATSCFGALNGTPQITMDRGPDYFLKHGITYEATYTVVNKITGIESNVGKPMSFVFYKPEPVEFEPIVYDRYCVFLGKILPSMQDIVRAISKNSGLSASNLTTNFPLNHFEYRLYYREVGSSNWLYVNKMSFAYVYKGGNDKFVIGRSNEDAVGLPAPQPGGYVDNSTLAEDKYIDVKSFAGKLWWVAKDAVRFSSDNAFSYPVRNYIAASSGEFRGAVVHYFAGQAEARGRLVVFGSKGMYDIRQTSEFQYTQIQVSPSSQPLSVPLPDSNFQVAERSSHTAFSGRCAVVAENALYFFGPSGIFRDDGVNLPIRISDAIEPDIFDSYDEKKTDEFFAYYNKKSQEIMFFYRPKNATNGDLTRAWVYSTRIEDWPRGIVGAWSKYGYKSLIDWAQELDLTNFVGGKIGGTLETPRGAGLRTMIGVRADENATVSRPYFHDDLCDCGDMTPGKEMMVRYVFRADSTTLRLYFTADHNSSIVSNAAIGSSVYIFGSQEYGKLTSNFDGLHPIKDKGAGYIDIGIDAGTVQGDSTLSTRSFFPVFFAEHDVTCTLPTNFFAPLGITKWLRFRYSHLLINPVNKRTGTAEASASVSWNCNHTQSTSVSKTIKPEALNTRERTTQIIFDMQSPGMQSEGQGIELGVTYNQRGPRWTLFAWTLWTAPAEGKRNILMYQQ